MTDKTFMESTFPFKLFLISFFMTFQYVMASPFYKGSYCQRAFIPLLSKHGDLSTQQLKSVNKISEKVFHLAGNDIYGLDIKLAQKMDRVFSLKLKNKIKNLSEDELANFKRIINRSKAGFLSFDGADVRKVHNLKKALIKFNTLYASHPGSRIILWHEIDHVIDIIRGRKLSHRNFETSAFKAQYDYTREVFDISDLDTLKRDFPTTVSPELVDKLISYKLLTKKSDDTYDFNFSLMKELMQDPLKANDIKLYIQNNHLNKFFITYVESALTLSKKKFVKESLAPYASILRKESIAKRKEFVLNGFAYGAFAAGAAYTVYLIMTDEPVFDIEK